MNPLQTARKQLSEQVYNSCFETPGMTEEAARTLQRNFEKAFEACECLTPMQAMFCMTGHVTECHFPRTCEEAECSHHQSEMEAGAEP